MYCTSLFSIGQSTHLSHILLFHTHTRHTHTHTHTHTRHTHTHTHHTCMHAPTHTRTLTHTAPGPTSVTLVVTKTTIFLAKENFTHWPLPRILELPPRDSLKPPYSDVQQRSITDVEQLVRVCLSWGLGWGVGVWWVGVCVCGGCVGMWWMGVWVRGECPLSQKILAHMEQVFLSFCV